MIIYFLICLTIPVLVCTCTRSVSTCVHYLTYLRMLLLFLAILLFCLFTLVPLWFTKRIPRDLDQWLSSLHLEQYRLNFVRCSHVLESDTSLVHLELYTREDFSRMGITKVRFFVRGGGFLVWWF